MPNISMSETVNISTKAIWNVYLFMHSGASYTAAVYPSHCLLSAGVALNSQSLSTTVVLRQAESIVYRGGYGY